MLRPKHLCQADQAAPRVRGRLDTALALRDSGHALDERKTLACAPKASSCKQMPFSRRALRSHGRISRARSSCSNAKSKHSALRNASPVLIQASARMTAVGPSSASTSISPRCRVSRARVIRFSQEICRCQKSSSLPTSSDVQWGSFK